MDEELKCLGRVYKELEKLDEPAKNRVIWYLMQRMKDDAIVSWDVCIGAAKADDPLEAGSTEPPPTVPAP